MPLGASLERCCRAWMRCGRRRLRRTAIDDGAPWSMRWGLFQGNSLGNAARDAYARELDGALLPRSRARFRQRLIDYAAEPEKLYEYLKAYLMLGDPSISTGAAALSRRSRVGRRLYADSPQRARVGGRALQQPARVRGHASPACGSTNRSSRRRAARSDRLRCRRSCTATCRSELREATRRARLRLDQAAGLGADRVLRRKSGISSLEPFPSLYTKPVFKEITASATAERSSSSSRPRTGCGATTAPALAGSAELTTEFIDVYEKDYIALGRDRQGHRARADGDRCRTRRTRWRSSPGRHHRCAGCSRRSTSTRISSPPQDPTAASSG